MAQGLERASKRSDPDRFEQEKLDFFEQVRDCYLSRAKDNTHCNTELSMPRKTLEQVQLDLG